ncbi:DNA-deoxyinosine glycosylase [Luteimonas fraxinea]|uniref:DNA-deoxyinosine glycosylase n=1 Tax=Luteimonas fraxinea TaxID=2901869 RepID=A0ABS8UE24_9GAMM|nr:DNA-deoxyinosine glycosylase [Luteimonas fraxinea]MCD9097112.1 DNA-deoxyinosine glycosylase [Luteimonas fraxinea]MCD9126624.1 DNA-deoxyinosine glycosylase [Luteimonas fraxinea]UHH09588.1 DNA-deoxyinosine glycosylase [Luteimonas fraxinea]
MTGSLIRSFAPVANDRARVLVLGSMPGVASLDADRYYAHPRNLFWPIVGTLFGFDPALSYDARLARLTACGVALWDVAGECVRPGSLDARIEAGSVVPNDIGGLLARYPGIERIRFNGAAAESLFRRHVLPTLDVVPDLLRLPSTSPAHAALGFEAKLAAWRVGLVGP